MSLKSAKVRDLHPAVRIVLETKPAEYEIAAGVGTAGPTKRFNKIANAEYLEITDVTACNTITSTLDGKASASITLASHRDTLFSRNRVWFRSKLERKQREISEYLSEVLKVSSINEINPRRRALRPGQGRVLGVPVEKLGRFKQRVLSVIQSENGHMLPGPEPKSRLDEYAAFEWFMADWEVMRRVYVDFRDRDGRWCPAFTGIVSTLADLYRAGDTPTVTVGCSGTMRFFELTEYITQQSLENLEWPFETGSNTFPVGLLSNSLGGLSPQEVVELVSRQVNYVYSLTGGNIYNDTRRPEDFYYHDPILDVSDAVGWKKGNDDNGAISPVRVFDSTTTPEDLLPKLIIDPQIVRPDAGRLSVYREMFRAAFELYNYENATAGQIGKESAAVFNYEWYEDPRGNINLQAPMYDSLPRIRGVNSVVPSEKTVDEVSSLGRQTPDRRNFVSSFLGPDSTDKLSTSKFGERYSTLPYHDDHYIVDDVGLVSWSLSTSEESIRTFVRVTGQPHFFNQGEDFRLRLNTGYTSYNRIKEISTELADLVQKQARRYGLRRFSAPPLNSNSVFGQTELLDRLAYAAMVRLNSFASSGTLTLEQRPDIWPARSLLLVERQKLGHVVRVANEFKSRQAHMTILTLANVRHPRERIGIPWWEATANSQPIAKIEGVLE
jgi:hypothetical protein